MFPLHRAGPVGCTPGGCGVLWVGSFSVTRNACRVGGRRMGSVKEFIYCIITGHYPHYRTRYRWLPTLLLLDIPTPGCYRCVTAGKCGTSNYPLITAHDRRYLSLPRKVPPVTNGDRSITGNHVTYETFDGNVKVMAVTSGHGRVIRLPQLPAVTPGNDLVMSMRRNGSHYRQLPCITAQSLRALPVLGHGTGNGR